MKQFLKDNKWPLIVTGLTLLARWVYLFELSRLPGFTVPMVDERWHWLWAQEIIEQSFWGDSAYFRAPLYPYMLAVLRWITDASIFWTKFLQILLCGGTAWFLYRLAERLFNRQVAIASGIVYAFYGPLIFYETMFLIPALFLMLLVWGLDRMIGQQENHAFGSWLLTGMLFGLAAISRPNVLLVMPFLALWLWHVSGGKSRWLKAARRPIILALGVVLMILPVTIRNVVVTEELMLISSQGGINLYLGNNKTADGLTMLMPEVELNESVTWSQFVPVTTAAAEKEVGHSLRPGEASSFWTGKAVDFIVSNPGKFMTLIGKKVVYLFNGYENSDNTNIYYQRNKSILHSVLVWKGFLYFPYGLLLPLAIVGLWVNRKRFSELAPLWIFLLAYIPTIVLFLVTARHRLPLVPFLIILAVSGAIGLYKAVRKYSKDSVPLLGVLLVPLMLVNISYLDADFSSTFQIHFNEGLKFQRLQDYESAEKEYLLADSEYPYSSSLIDNLAHAQFKLGKLDDADRNFHRALSINPKQARSYSNLGLVLRQRGNLDSAAILFSSSIKLLSESPLTGSERAQIYINLGSVCESLQRIDEATDLFDHATKVDRNFSRGYLQAAAFFARRGQFAKADTLFFKGKVTGNLNAGDYFNWGLARIEEGKPEEGVKFMYSALRENPRLYQAHYCIAVAYFEGRMPADSVNYHLDRCLNFGPDYQPAIRLKQLMIDGGGR